MIEDRFTETYIDNIELQKYINDYLESISNKKEQTQQTYKKALLLFLKYKNRKNFGFTVDDIKKYRHHIQRVKKMKSYSVSTYLTALRQFLNYLVRIQVLEKNPAKRVKFKIKEREIKFDFLTKKQVNALINSIDTSNEIGLRDKALIQTMLYSACSEKDISNLMISDFFQNGKKAYFKVPKHGANNSAETIEIPNTAAKAINEFLKNRSNMFSNEPLFVSYSNRSNNKKITVRGVREIINQRTRECNLLTSLGVKLTPFTIKHTAGIIYVTNNPNIEKIIARLDIKHSGTIQKFFDNIENYQKG